MYLFLCRPWIISERRNRWLLQRMF